MSNVVHYLDYAATCPTIYWNKDYSRGEHNSNATYAAQEQTELEYARDTIKKQLGVTSGYVLFTRCATESIEWLSNWLNIEYDKAMHDSVFNCWNNNNWETMYCYQLVNPLTGEITNKIPFKDKVDFLGVDYTAAIGHMELPKNIDKYVDAIWFSPHKFGCEKGIGVLWIGDKLFHYLNGNTNPKNQYGLIHGTVNVAGAIAVAKAMETVNAYVNEDINVWNGYLYCLMSELNYSMTAVNIRAYDKEKNGGTSAINLIWLKGINADALQTWLAEKNIYVSVAASACSEDNTKYRVTKELGIDNEIARQCIRVSFGVDTTLNDIKALANAIIEFKEMF